MECVLANEVRDFGVASCESRTAAFDAVLLDLDGTLIDTERVCRAAFSAALAEIGYPSIESHYALLIGRSTPDRRQLLTSWYRRFPCNAFFDAYRRIRDRRFEAGIALKPGAAELIATLREQGVPFAVVTAASHVGALARLRKAGLAVSIVVTRDDVRCTKPDPACMLFAAERLSIAPERCLVIEDSLPGLEAGCSAGMQVILVPDLFPPPTWRGMSMPTLHHVTELLQPDLAVEVDSVRDFRAPTRG